MCRQCSRWLAFLLHAATVLVLLLFPRSVWAGLDRQEATPSPEVSQILESLGPEERVGQLFIVTFQGTSVAEESAIHTLITRYHIGGVVLSAANDNFDDRVALLDTTAELTAALQRAAFEAANPPSENGVTPTPLASTYLPLLIGIEHAGNGAAGSQLLSGSTELPSAMALGATWSPENANLVGEVAGAELRRLGFNMLLGPSLDVLSDPQPSSSGDLGVRSFGGNPYWVSVLGSAYIEGIKAGSGGQIAVIARHFPGLGAGDRNVTNDIPTVNKSLEELQAADLAPFLDVASLIDDVPAFADGLQTAHARYTALQGATTPITRPLSLDGQAMTQLLQLPEIAEWYTAGGVTVSDSLGGRGVRLFYDPTGATFPAFNIARDALLAGNDLLYLDQFAPTQGSDQAQTIIDTIQRFVQKYEEDPAFAERVDQAVTRIIALKLRLHGRFSLSGVLPANDLSSLGARTPEMFAIARQAATLLSPAQAELTNRLPLPPAPGEQIVFVTDELVLRQCSLCVLRNDLGPEAMQQAALRLYGVGGTGQVRDEDLSSFNFVDLENFLSGVVPPEEEPTITPDGTEEIEEPTATPEVTEEPELSIGDALTDAEWIVFGLRNIAPEDSESNALRRFLAERPDLLAGRNVIVFAFGAPYLLDATEVAQLTAYYGLYSHTPPFVEVAARILFQEITPEGASPVSIPALSYAIERQLSPAPDQPFHLFLEVPEAEQEAEVTPSPEVTTPTATLTLAPEEITPLAPDVPEGTTVNLATSVLVDHNGNVVPDGTAVEFAVTYLAEGRLTEIFGETGTVEGVSRATLVLNRTGLLEIRASSGEALSDPLQINVFLDPEGETAIEVLPSPTLTATATFEPTETEIPPSATPTPTQPPLPPEAPPPHVNLRDLLSALLAIVVLGTVGWRFSNSRKQAISNGVKIVLAVAIGVGLGYNYYAFRGPGWEGLETLGAVGSSLLSWSGGVLGLVVGWFLLNHDRGKVEEKPG